MMTLNEGRACTDTVKIVQRCPEASEVDQEMIIRKCFGVCGDFKGSYKYHCVRDSLKTNFIELCAIPKRLFVYCPEYELIGQIIQMDISTLCNTNHSSQTYYDSSDMSFCDPDNCLQLYENKVNTTRATEVTTNNEGAKHNWTSRKWYSILIPTLLGIAILIAILCAIYRKRKYGSYLTKESP